MPAPKAKRVSSNNPCPFLRSLVAHGLLANDVVPVGELTDTILRVAESGDGQPDLPATAIRAIALTANGLNPLQIARNGLEGVHLDALRNGPLDKKGVGSGILGSSGRINRAELARLDSFASRKQNAKGRGERGLDLSDLQRMMDANFERAKGRRRLVDRTLMDGEWPILLKVMGKEGVAGRYLSLKELHTLFVDRRLPQRMLRRMRSA